MPRISRHQHRQEVSRLRRGDVCLVRQTRPALVIQNDVGNQFSPLTVVAAITSKVSPEPFPVEVAVAPSRANGLSQQSAIRLDQIRTIDRSRVVKRLGAIDAASMRKVDEAIKISLGLIEF
jgi:mRNA interferase MazF